MFRLSLFCVMLFLANIATAQDFSFGFKTGLNFSEIKGDPEEGTNATETFDRNLGFHFGATFAWHITEMMGLKGELMYSQKGTRRNFEGDSYYNFLTPNNEAVRVTGVRKQELNITNSYLDLPVTFFVKPFSRFEIYGGASIGVLVKDDAGSSASPNTFEHELDFSYFSNEPGEMTYDEPASTVRIKNEEVPYPQTAGAYYESLEDRGRPYKGIDLGLVGGVSVYLSKSLYVSGRINYGLLDITKSKADVSLSKLDENNEFISRNDDDRNVSLQASIGFSF
jgi:Outer membrane protein beta-barrel domain